MRTFMNHEFDISQILLACYVAPGEGKTVHHHRAGHGLALMLSAEKIYTFGNGKVVRAGSNEIVYLPKHSDYVVNGPAQGSCYAINFDLAEDVSFPPFAVKARNVSDYLQAFRIAEQVWKTRQHGYAMKCKEQLYHILCQMQKEYHAAYIEKSKWERITPAVQRIHEGYSTEPLTVAELSALCDMTPEYFRRIFRAFYGTSPVKYINDLRLSRAKELIASGFYSITEAAARSGFSDMSYFSRVFKKATGLPPSEWRP